MAETTIECTCGGTGALTYKEGNMLGTRLCACRKQLPPREGKASWWSSENIFASDVETVMDHGLTVTARCEVPISEDNYRVVRRCNRYYPCMVDVDSDDAHFLLTPDEATRFGNALLKAAKAAEEVDAEDSSPCGHWYPCECAQEAVEAAV